MGGNSGRARSNELSFGNPAAFPPERDIRGRLVEPPAARTVEFFRAHWRMSLSSPMPKFARFRQRNLAIQVLDRIAHCNFVPPERKYFPGCDHCKGRIRFSMENRDMLLPEFSAIRFVASSVHGARKNPVRAGPPEADPRKARIHGGRECLSSLMSRN